MCRSFHGLINFRDCAQCDIAMLQETNTQSNPSLPDDQPFHYEGPADTHGREAAFLIRNDRAILCNLIPNITPHVDICWRVVDHGSTCPATAIASYYAPHVGCPEADRVSFWQRLLASLYEVVQATPGAEIVMMGDSNLWVPGLVDGHDMRPADRNCVEILNTILDNFGLAICNPTNAPTHVRGAALDLIIASPGVVNDVQVHNAYHCACTDQNLCCPLLGSDHFAVTVSLNKSNVVPARSPTPQSVCVRDWTRLIQDQRQLIQAWATRVRYQSQRGLSASQADNRSSLDGLVRDLIDILWKAAPSHYRR